MTIERLVEIVKRKHYPRRRPACDSIERFQQKHAVVLPADMKEFYSRCNGACLFDKIDASYDLLPLSRIARVRALICGGEDTDEHGPESWYGFCDVQDGNYVAIDLDPASDAFSRVFDCFHETFPDPKYIEIIARSFSEFLERALSSKGRLYWLKG